jgi:hypothetical protein
LTNQEKIQTQMKKLLLLAAFAGLLGSTAVANTKGDDKDKKGKKECCKKDGKACAGEKKDGEMKSCCKKKAEVSDNTKPTEEKK